MQSAFDATVSGRVQVVMYRDFCQRKASGLKLVGEVENMSDGTVRVHAEGEKEALDRFAELLTQGSLLSKVRNVDVRWVEPLNTFTRFSIKYP